LKLEYDEPHSKFASIFNLRRYTMGVAQRIPALAITPAAAAEAATEAGAYTRPLQLNLSRLGHTSL
jgi:hypothetical protein